MTDWKETNRLCALREQAVPEKPLRANTLRRLLTNIDEFAKSRHADGLTNSSLIILDGAFRLINLLTSTTKRRVWLTIQYPLIGIDGFMF